MANGDGDVECSTVATTDTTFDKHEEYYFTNITFLVGLLSTTEVKMTRTSNQVENQLFKVPRRNFAVESETFSDMLRLPAPTVDGKPLLDGSSDSQPLRLEGIKKFDFLQLLRVMFPSLSRSLLILVTISNVNANTYTSRDSQEPDSLTQEEWTSVLKLSTMWHFRKIRAAAIRNMENLSIDPVDKIVIATASDIPAWLVPALNELARRHEPIDLSEGNRLGMEWVLKIAELRECDSNPTCPHCSRTGSAMCQSCTSTIANRCASCYRPLTAASGKPTKRGNRAKVDYSEKIREAFNLS
jgi:hypothetical protein